MDEVDVHVEVEVNPTEDPEKVRKAVENIFGSVEFEVKTSRAGKPTHSEKQRALTGSLSSTICFAEKEFATPPEAYCLMDWARSP